MMFDWLRNRLDDKIAEAGKELSLMQRTVRQEEAVVRSHVGGDVSDFMDHNHGVLYRLGARLDRLEAWRDLLR